MFPNVQDTDSESNILTLGVQHESKNNQKHNMQSHWVQLKDYFLHLFLFFFIFTWSHQNKAVEKNSAILKYLLYCFSVQLF